MFWNYEFCKIKYQRFTLSGCKDIVIRKFEFNAKTQFLPKQNTFLFCIFDAQKLISSKGFKRQEKSFMRQFCHLKTIWLIRNLSTWNMTMLPHDKELFLPLSEYKVVHTIRTEKSQESKSRTFISKKVLFRDLNHHCSFIV